MKNFLLCCTCCAVFFVSCRRDNNNLTGNAQLVLTIDSVFQTDKLTNVDSTLFSYDGAGRLASWSTRNEYVSYSVRHDYQITRDGQNRITKIIDNFLEGYSGFGPTSTPVTIHEVHYSGVSDQASFIYDYTDGSLPSSGDSTAITYTGNNISDIKVYPLTPATAQPPFTESTWTYDNSGSLLSYISGAENAEAASVYAYAFDENVNPLRFDIEGIFSEPTRMSNGNLISSQQNLVGYGSNDQEYFTYTYRSDGRPLRAVSAGTSRITTTYVYSN